MKMKFLIKETGKIEELEINEDLLASKDSSYMRGLRHLGIGGSIKGFMSEETPCDESTFEWIKEVIGAE